MITIPVEDFVFAAAALIGAVLLLITVVFDDILAGLFDAFGLEFGGTSVTPLLLGFVAALAGGLFAWLRRSESEEPFSLRDLVGDSGFVSVGIPAGRYGSVMVHAEGQAHEFAATSSVEIPAGVAVRIVGVAGTGLVVETAGPLAAGTDAPSGQET
jgi:membrane protein implicated in regulation of membrane protease activity